MLLGYCQGKKEMETSSLLKFSATASPASSSCAPSITAHEEAVVASSLLLLSSFQFLRSSDPSVATTTPAKMEGAQDWYLHEDLTNLFLLEESELLIYQPLFLDVVTAAADDQEPEEQHPDLTLVAKETTSAAQASSRPSSLAKTDPQYQCPLCSKSFQFKSRLQRHLTSHQV